MPPEKATMTPDQIAVELDNLRQHVATANSTLRATMTTLTYLDRRIADISRRCPVADPLATPADEKGQLLTAIEAARRLGVSRRTVFRLFETGALPRVRMGNRTIRIPATAIADFVRDATTRSDG